LFIFVTSIALCICSDIGVAPKHEGVALLECMMGMTAKVEFAESAEVTLGREQRSAEVEGKRAIPETLGNRKQSQ
jgi:hypothetical protein